MVKFELLDFPANMPCINVTMEHTDYPGMTVDFWELLNRLDSKHQMQLHTNQPGKLERILITGHPGAGKMTLMRYLTSHVVQLGLSMTIACSTHMIARTPSTHNYIYFTHLLFIIIIL